MCHINANVFTKFHGERKEEKKEFELVPSRYRVNTRGVILEAYSPRPGHYLSDFTTLLTVSNLLNRSRTAGRTPQKNHSNEIFHNPSKARAARAAQQQRAI